MTLEGETAGWFADWAIRRPADSSRHVTAGWHALSSLKDAGYVFSSVLEMFGGMGCQALIAERLFMPAEHVIRDWNPAAARHLRRVLPECTVEQADSYALTGTNADLVIADFGDLTALQMIRGRARYLLDAIFSGKPKAVVLTDIAGARLHLQAERYAKLLDHDCGSYPEYLAGLSAWIRKTWGYRTLSCYEHRWSAVMALVPGDGENAAPAPVPDRPAGIAEG
jgi:hypothetical protein